MARKLFIKTFGCQMNEYDSARMADVLAVSHGLESTDDPAQADVLLLNTCSIREKAQEKVFTQLGFWRALKQARPGVVIGVGGCVASRRRARPSSGAPHTWTWCSGRRRCTACHNCSIQHWLRISQQ